MGNNLASDDSNDNHIDQCFFTVDILVLYYNEILVLAIYDIHYSKK